MKLLSSFELLCAVTGLKGTKIQLWSAEVMVDSGSHSGREIGELTCCDLYELRKSNLGWCHSSFICWFVVVFVICWFVVFFGWGCADCTRHSSSLACVGVCQSVPTCECVLCVCCVTACVVLECRADRCFASNFLCAPMRSLVRPSNVSQLLVDYPAYLYHQ